MPRTLWFSCGIARWQDICSCPYRDGLGKAEWSPGCFADACTIRHKKTLTEPSTNTAEGAPNNLLKYKSLTAVLSRTAQGNTLTREPRAGPSPAEPGHRNQAAASDRPGMPKALYLLSHRPHATTDLRGPQHSQRNPCCHTFAFYKSNQSPKDRHVMQYSGFISEASHPSCDLTSLSNTSQAHRLTGRCSTLLQDTM